MPPRNACYHAQQAVEKLLKAALIFAKIGFAFGMTLIFSVISCRRIGT